MATKQKSKIPPFIMKNYKMVLDIIWKITKIKLKLLRKEKVF